MLQVSWQEEESQGGHQVQCDQLGPFEPVRLTVSGDKGGDQNAPDQGDQLEAVENQ
jgi:hypothetical protein